MYQSPTALQPPLAPVDYHSERSWSLELRAVFADSWHLVGTYDSLAKPGQYLSRELFGIPIVVRNFGEELVALRNVCAHRQCRLVDKVHGQNKTLTCPYHGWEYGADGLTRKIPGASNFPHFPRNDYRLDRFAVARCGQLVFVRLSETGPSLEEWMGERFSRFASWFSEEEWTQTLALPFEYPSNWKVPVEASLESYHIPWVHPNTFHEDPGESRSTHDFFTTGSSFEASFMTPRWIDHRLKDAERWTMWMLGVPFTGRYQHHQIYPNLMISHTDSLSLAQVVFPTGPKTSIGYVWQFGRRSERNNPLSRLTAWWWGKFSTWLTIPILNEDVRIYPLAQAGVTGARRPGLLGRCEERLYSSQKYLRGRMDEYEITHPDWQRTEAAPPCEPQCDLVEQNVTE